MSCLTSQHSLICSFLAMNGWATWTPIKIILDSNTAAASLIMGSVSQNINIFAYVALPCPKHQHLCLRCFAMSKTWIFNLNASILAIVHTVCKWSLQVHLVFLFFFICLLVVVKYIRNSRLYAQTRCKLNAWKGPQNGTYFFPCVVYATVTLFLFLCRSYC
jgi:hypothetical protein